MDYPLHYIIKSRLAQPELAGILDCVRTHRSYIEQVRDTKNEKSRKIELILKPDLGRLGFTHSATNRDFPLFQENSQFEINFLIPTPASPSKSSAAICTPRSGWLCPKMLESNLVRHGLIFVPVRRIVRNSPENSFELTYKRLRDNAHNLLQHLESLIVVGY